MLEGNQSVSGGNQSSSGNSVPSQPSLDEQVESLHSEGVQAYHKAVELHGRASNVDGQPNDLFQQFETEAGNQELIVFDAQDRLLHLELQIADLSEHQKAVTYEDELRGYENDLGHYQEGRYDPHDYMP